MRNFLLIDDDSIFNFISKRTLEKMHIVSDVRIALNGREALALLNDLSEERLPDIILLDIHMPVLDGFGFLEFFSQLALHGKENVKIIIVTSSMDPLDIARAKRLGASVCISKPLMVDALLAALQY